MSIERNRAGSGWTRALAPLLVAAVFTAVVGALLWAGQLQLNRSAERELLLDSESARQGILADLRSNEDFLALLAGLMVSGDFDESDFEQRAAAYQRNHPELLNLTWSDSDFVIRWAAPAEPNKEVIGLPLSLSEPERASRLAKATSRGIYTNAFVVVQNVPSFELYVPVVRGGEFLGNFAAVYSIEALLADSVPGDVHTRYQSALLEQSGRVVLELPAAEPVDDSLTRVLPLDPPGYGISLRLSAYEPRLAWQWWAAGIALSVLALLAGGYGAWRALTRTPPPTAASDVGRHRPTLHDWLAPAAFTTSLLIALAALLWAIRAQQRSDQMAALKSAEDVTVESLDMRLRGNQGFLEMLAAMSGDGKLDLGRFQDIGSRYVAAHPELLNLTWVDEDLVVRAVAPLEGNSQIVGLPVQLPEPAKAAERATATRTATYTKPFEAIQGDPSFELWMPVFGDEAFRGLLVVVYSAEQVLENVVPPDVRASYQVQLRDDDAGVLATLHRGGSLNPDIRSAPHTVLAGTGMRLQLTDYGGEFFSPAIIGAGATAFALAVGMLISMVSLRREVVQRQRVEGELLLVNRNLETTVGERTAELADRNVELEAARRELEGIAYVDVLTGLANRRRFTEVLAQAVADCRAQGQIFVLMVLDLDRFKHVNDTFGHVAGDVLLQAVAARVRASVRHSDFLARIGGDEFALVLAPIDGAEYRADPVVAVRFADELCRRIMSAFVEPVEYQQSRMMTAPSIGIARFPADGDTEECLLHRADLALYAAKQAGRAQWKWFDPSLDR